MAEEAKRQKGAKSTGKAGPSAASESKKSKDEASAAKKLEVAKDAEDTEEEADARQGDAPEEAPRDGEKAKAERPKAKPSKTAAAADDDAEEGDDAEEDGEEEEKGEKKVKLKPRPRPKLVLDLKRALEQRKVKSANRQEFHRQEWFRYQRLGDKWRYPQGIQSKMRRHWKTHADVVSIGHRGPKIARGLHPSGFREVVIHNSQGLDGVDPASEAIRIAGSVGRRKREAIQKVARKRGIRVLNWKVWRD